MKLNHKYRITNIWEAGNETAANTMVEAVIYGSWRLPWWGIMYARAEYQAGLISKKEHDSRCTFWGSLL